MKGILSLSIVFFSLAAGVFGQTTRAEPVPGVPPMVFGPGGFETLEDPARLDSFADLDEKTLKFRVDRFISILSEKNKTVEYLIVLNADSKSLSSKIEWFAQYLKSKKLSSEKYSFGFAKTINGQTELWLAPNRRVSAPMYRDILIIGGDDAKGLEAYLNSL